ncbi:hypothetical protein [Dehalogenimonas etheniformans]|uniref:Ferric oxidoreductase domain-containing protein n=1 Tax=Dehalogenimonas etheniformans TaxID=1536648 RepID=A0A2P5P9X9_9CHLR|nr:hypothetical protein [Dehalogenimonas etheniformans]PPD59090.1 hypothetical protein JP09_000710 [Dehalogenimonas etheniformans]QNT76772.1 hypothetical protein HX448_08810 [Dehalogenimonas etheniformans]
MEQRRDWLQIGVALAIILSLIFLSIGTYFRWWDLRFDIGSFSFTHWLSWIGAGYLTIFVPLYSVLKRQSKIPFATILTVHVFGNLIAFGMISVHFAQQLGRPTEFAPDFGTGLAMYLIITGIVATGLMRRFGTVSPIYNNLRFIHVGLALSLIFILPIHILHNLNVI